MDKEIREFVEAYQYKPMPKITVSDFMISLDVGIPFHILLKGHNHEIWRKCQCGNEEDLRKTFECSECGAVLFKTSK